jgi:hypothetical protein
MGTASSAPHHHPHPPGLGLNEVASRFYYRHFHGSSRRAPAGGWLHAIFAEAARRGSLVEADYAEFGISRGTASGSPRNCRRSTASRPVASARQLRGLPEIRGIDRTRHGEFRKGQYACSLETVRQN